MSVSIPRDERGRILPGPMSSELKEAISQGQIKRHMLAREDQDEFAITQKKCTVCKEWKNVPDDYSMRKRRLKSGIVNHYPAGECLKCANKRRKKWKQDYIDEHGLEAWKKYQRESSANRNKEVRNRYNRERGRLQRLEEGATPRGPWKKYRDEAGGSLGREMVSSSKLRQWLESLDADSRTMINAHPTLLRSVHRVCYEQENVELGVLDSLATLMGDPGLITLLSNGGL